MKKILMTAAMVLVGSSAANALTLADIVNQRSPNISVELYENGTLSRDQAIDYYIQGAMRGGYLLGHGYEDGTLGEIVRDARVRGWGYVPQVHNSGGF